MVIEDLDRFRLLEEACGSRYLAVRYISNVSRTLGHQNEEYYLSESKLLQWVLTGTCPYSKSKLEYRRYIFEQLDDLDEYLYYVEDKVVYKTVRSLYKQSIRNKKLTYCTDQNITQGQRSRINILLRMIWYGFKTEG